MYTYSYISVSPSLSLFLSMYILKYIYIYFKYLFIFREGKEKKRERNINMWLPSTHPHLGTWPATQAPALTGNPTRDTSVHRLPLDPLSYTSQGLIYF